MHGLFSSDSFRASFLKRLGHRAQTHYEQEVDATLDALADHLEHHLDVDRLFELSRAPLV